MLKIAPCGQGRGWAQVPPAAVSPGRQSPGNLAREGREGRGAAPPQGKHGRHRYCRAVPLVPLMRLRHWQSATAVQRDPEQQLRVAEDPAPSM
ncbi:hypothetical protein NDU88_003150 [Pleurodeles waltl]|uniref:Uncharacterized protein n=1 Tax=Pleurodeles waltl TaxID=8319 RepID=A0AAV7UF83_PLEWA|nr:hypothetical protein NDU88_003150 [Pleurodeles waltl]